MDWQLVVSYFTVKSTDIFTMYNLAQKTKIAEFEISVDPDEAPHLDLHCLPISL